MLVFHNDICSVSVVGISGARRPATCSLRALTLVLGRLSPSTRVVVGCARGIDVAVRSTVPATRLHVFRASSFGFGPGSYAARSIACVCAVAGGSPSCPWVVFPATSCPVGLMPSFYPAACFSGSSSGTWASLAFDVGLGVPCLVFLPPGVSAPKMWPLTQVHGTRSWRQFSPVSVQGTLF